MFNHPWASKRANSSSRQASEFTSVACSCFIYLLKGAAVNYLERGTPELPMRDTSWLGFAQ